MATKTQAKRIQRTEAYFSADRKYRYWLLRVWDEDLPIMANIGCNPSTADELFNDPTIRKDMGFAERLGFGGLLKLNAGAYRATDPKRWLQAADPFGPENSAEHFRYYLARFKTQATVVAWGRCIGRFAARADQLVAGLPGLQCFGRNSNNTPRHTLMLPYSTKLEPYFLEIANDQ